MIDVIKNFAKQANHELRLTEIEKGYTPEEEVARHLWADVIIIQGPVFWFGLPWTYKKYIEDVFTTGYLDLFVSDGRSGTDPSKQYGTGGNMHGKKAMLSLTWNAPSAAFNNRSQYLYSGMSVDDAFVSHTATYKSCGASILPSFSCFDAVKSPDIEKYTTDLELHLKKHLA